MTSAHHMPDDDPMTTPPTTGRPATGQPEPALPVPAPPASAPPTGAGEEPLNADVIAADLRKTLLLASRNLRRRKAGGSGELSDSQFSVLAVLNHGGDLSIGALAEVERVRPPAMTRTVTVLESAGHVRRAADPGDGRRTVVSLTDSGREIV